MVVTYFVLQDWSQQVEHSMLPQSLLLKETDGAPWCHKKTPPYPPSSLEEEMSAEVSGSFSMMPACM